MDEMTNYSLVRDDEVIGGATGDARQILYTPAEQGRAKTNVNAELDRLNTQLANTFQGDFTELVKSNTVLSWTSQTVADLKGFREIAIGIGGASPDDITNMATIPIALFKSHCTSPQKALVSQAHIFSTNQSREGGVYYIDDTHVGVFNNVANYYVTVWGVK